MRSISESPATTRKSRLGKRLNVHRARQVEHQREPQAQVADFHRFRVDIDAVKAPLDRAALPFGYLLIDSRITMTRRQRQTTTQLGDFLHRAKQEGAGADRRIADTHHVKLVAETQGSLTRR